MTTTKMLRLLDAEEQKRYEDLQRKEFEVSSTHNLEVYFQLNLKLKQQIGIKLAVLEEVLEERKPDFKLKQAKD